MVLRLWGMWGLLHRLNYTTRVPDILILYLYRDCYTGALPVAIPIPVLPVADRGRFRLHCWRFRGTEQLMGGWC